MATARFLRWFRDLTIADVGVVGGKNASLGEMYRELRPRGLRVPNGFALTALALDLRWTWSHAGVALSIHNYKYRL